MEDNYNIKMNDSKDDNTLKQLSTEQILEIINTIADNVEQSGNTQGVEKVNELIFSIIEENDNTEDLITKINNELNYGFRHYIVDTFISHVNMFLIMNNKPTLSKAEEEELVRIFLEEGYPKNAEEMMNMVERAKERAKKKELTVGKPQPQKPKFVPKM